MLICFPWLHSGLSAFKEECLHPKLMDLAPTWSQRCESTTGLPTEERKKPSDKSWLWMPTVGQRIAWTPSFHIVPRITRKLAAPHQARCKVLIRSLWAYMCSLIFPGKLWMLLRVRKYNHRSLAFLRYGLETIISTSLIIITPPVEDALT